MRRIVISSLLLILSAALSGTCFGAAAVLLNNYDSLNPILVFEGTGYVQIYAGADMASVTSLVSTGGGNGVFALDQGFFDGGIGNIPGLADNVTAAFVAHVWLGDNRPGGWVTASSEIAAYWTQQTGNNTPPNLPAPATLNIPPIILPEPTTWVLGLMGAALLLCSRCKRLRSGSMPAGPN